MDSALEKDDISDLAISVKNIDLHMKEAIDCYKTCQDLLQDYKELSIKEASIKLAKEKPGVTQLALDVPPPIAPPKLVDIE